MSTMTEIATPWLTFAGSNERGTPPMPGKSVRHDLKVLRDQTDSFALCEFKWDYYWEQAKAEFRHGERDHNGKRSVGVWGSSPSMDRGIVAPVFSAQPNFWDRGIFRRVKSKRALLHVGMAGISETRLIRASLLQHIATGLDHWEAVTHFVVGGDAATDSKRRKRILRKNIRRFAKFIGKLVKSGKAIIAQLDANIHKGTWAYTEFMKALAPYKPKFHGELGIEYLFTIDGRDTKIEVRRDFAIKPERYGGELKTDHEARAIVYRLVKKIRPTTP